ncbi:unnamed protein product, partial [Staurois parvus]
LCQSLHWPPFSVFHLSLPITPLASIQFPPPLSANPSTGLHSVSSTPLCQSLHWPPFSVFHPSLPIPPLASIQCLPPLSANSSTGLHSCPPPPSVIPSTGLHSVSSTPLCHSLHWPPLSVLHPPLSFPPLAPIAQRIKFKLLTLTYKAIHNSAPNYLTDLIPKYHPTHNLCSSQDLLLSSSLVSTSHARLKDFSRTSPILWNSLPQSIRLSPSLLTFRRTLKTLLFREAYPALT